MYLPTVSLFVRRLLPVALLVGALGTAVWAGPAVIRVESIENAALADTVELAVIMDAPHDSSALTGFNLLLTYDQTGMAFLAADAGQLLVDCQWEYFTYRSGIDSTLGGSPLALVRLVAIAEINNGSVHPDCPLDTPGELARLRFRTTASPGAADHQFPVRFYWHDCDDNVFADSTGDTLLISNRVFEFGQEITEEHPFPTYFGAPSACLIQSTIIRGADFYNGSVRIDAQAAPPDAPVRVVISPLEAPVLGGPVEFAAQLHQVQSGLALGGFDFLVRYDPAQLTWMSAQPGNLLESCGWEYFTFAAGAQAECGQFPCPAGVARVIAVADLASPTGTPTCGADTEGTLANFLFTVANDTSLIGRPLAVEWYWYTCDDNRMAVLSGDTTFISRSVYDHFGQPAPADTAFPTASGAPSLCAAGPDIIPGIDFFAGWTRAHPSEIDLRGDVNLNGIANEVSDYVLFGNYFFYGLAAFTANVATQIATTDVNADGLPLTLDDHVFLARIVVGDAIPFPRPNAAPTDTAVIVQDGALGSVIVTYPGSLRAVYVVFDGAVLYDGPFGSMPEPWPHLGGHTPLL
nr:hypothetical protein [candidate division Zixibacteria bacterium]